MAKTASQRRLAKRAAELGALRSTESVAFARAWAKLVEGWLGEINHRAHAMRVGTTGARGLPIFGVLTQARNVVEATGVLSNPDVEQSLVVLRHACANAVAALTDRRLYDFSADCTTRVRESLATQHG